jgi:hypothetical protein
MAQTYASKDVGFFLVSGKHVLGGRTEIIVDREAKIEETTDFGIDWNTFGDTGGRGATLAQKGFFDAATDRENDAICGQEGASHVICIALCGNVAGRVMLALAGALAAKYKRSLNLGVFHKSEANWSVQSAADDATIIAALAAVTADGNTQALSIDNGASSASGGNAYLQVTDLSLGGYTSLTVKLRHSTDNVTFTDLLTMTAVTGAQTAEKKTVTGTVNRYVAASHVFNGAGAAHSATYVLGFARAA